MARGLIYKVIGISLICCHAFIGAQHPSAETQAAVAPYLLPEDHPIKPDLDRIFSASRVIFNVKTLAKAGFDKSKPREFSKVVVTKHSELPGYVFKLYLDTQKPHKGKPEHHYWILRITGAQKIQQEITKQGWENSFKVPKKWIYALPEDPSPPEGYYTKHYILVEEDMDILSNDKNKKMWGSKTVTRPLLSNLFYILKTIGLIDCAKPANIPFGRDGRIAFIDTQSHGVEKMRYKGLTGYLSSSNQRYWGSLKKQDNKQQKIKERSEKKKNKK